MNEETTVTLKVAELDRSYHKPVMSLTIEGRADKLREMAFAEFVRTITDAILELQRK